VPSSGGNTVQRLYEALVSTIRLTITRAQESLPRFPRALLVASFCISTVVAAATLSREAAAAQAELVPAQDTASLLGGGRAQGAVIWSHGRSLQKECDVAPTPDYIGAFRSAGWDTFRLNRPGVIDTLQDSADALAGEAEALKHRGYRRVVLAGQSFGAFVSLIAAGRSDQVDAVIGTAPAAYGSARSNPFGFELNATRLYDLLATVRRARVALFFFEGDIFDPGGRGPISDQILDARGLAHLVVDRPAGLPTHWGAAGAPFAAQFGPCLVAFAADDSARGSLDCGSLEAAGQLAGRSRLTSLPPAN
jgi:pimeloyl-ACP methyl ester carboxylesterase